MRKTTMDDDVVNNQDNQLLSSSSPSTPFEKSSEIVIKESINVKKDNSSSVDNCISSTPKDIANSTENNERKYHIDDDNGDDDHSLAEEEVHSPRNEDTKDDSKVAADKRISTNVTEQNSTQSPHNGRRVRRLGALSKGLDLSPKLTPSRSRRRNLGPTSQSPKPPPLALYNSVMSIDWRSSDDSGTSDDSVSFTSERDRKKNKYDESLIFDDDLSLALDQALSEDDENENDKNDSTELQESGYQLSGVCTMVDGTLSQTDHSISTASPQTASASYVESNSSSSRSSQKEKWPGEVYGSNFGLWGREKELYSLESRLLAATAEISSQYYTIDDNFVDAAQKHVWISGVSGIGKTSLIDAFLRHDNLLQMQPFICRGTFEENWISACKPFPGIISCFTYLFESFLNGNDAEKWGARMQICLKDKNDMALLVSLIPSLAILLDVDNDDTKYSFDETDKFLFERLSRALGRILVFTCKYSIVIFFLDDVQWAGEDSLQLLKALLLKNDLNNFFFVGSHRSGVKVSHHLHKIKAEVSTLFGADIKLGGIGTKYANLLVRRHLSRLDNESAIDTGMLDSLVKSWCTNSNSKIPMFLEHLVNLSYEKTRFQLKNGRWILDSLKVLPSSSLSLVVERMEGLPIEHDLVLQSAALLDSYEFNINMLMVAITAIPKSQKFEIDIDKVESIVRILIEKMLIEEHSTGRYAFAHNIVKVAATSRIPVATKRKRSRLHWRLATDLKRQKDNAFPLESEIEKWSTSLLIANHLKKGISSMGDRKNTEMVVKLYVQLAEAAMKKSAFVTASNILETGITTLDKKLKWEESYDLTLKIHLALARCLYCSDELDKAKSILNTIIANAHPPRDTIDAFDLLISIYRSKMQYEQSKQCTLKALNDIWDDDVSNSNVEEKFSKIRKLVQKKSDADLLVLPNLEHTKISKKMPFLLKLAEISGLCRDYKLQDLAALRMVELTLKYGSYETNFTGLVFALFGLCVARRHLYGEAYRYGRLAEMISEKDNPLGRQAIVQHNYHMRHWRNHMRGSRKSLKEICRASMEANGIENLSFQVGAYLSTIFYTGAPFNCEDDLLERYNHKRKQFELPEYWNVVAPYNALVKLNGETSKLIKTKYSDSKAVQYDLFFQMVVSVFMTDMDKAEKLNSKLFMKPGGCWGSYRLFMEGLIATYYAQLTSGKNKALYQNKASECIELLTTWTRAGMSNSAHMANILKVELMIASDKGITSKRLSILLDTAIASAYQDGFLHHAALASERAGKYLLRTEDVKLASKYLSRASVMYSEWGAIAKSKQLESGYGKYLNADLAPIKSFKRSNSTPSGSLMFTDRKPDSASLRSGRRPEYRSRSQDDHRSPVGKRRSLSSDSRVLPIVLKKKKNTSKQAVQKTQSSHARGRPVLSKAAKEADGSRSKSLHQISRPSLIRVGSWASIKSNISNISDDYRGSKKKNSSNDSRSKAKEEKGKAMRRKSSSPKATERRRKPIDERERKNRGKSVDAANKTKNGSSQSPKPRKNKVVVNDDDWSVRSYLFNYDTDDFDTINGDSDASFTPKTKSNKSEALTKRQTLERTTKKTEKKSTPKTVISDGKTSKKTNKKKKKDSPIEESINGTNDEMLVTPKRRTKGKIPTGVTNDMLGLATPKRRTKDKISTDNTNAMLGLATPSPKRKTKGKTSPDDTNDVSGTPKRKTKTLKNKISTGVTNDMLATPKRKPKTLKSKILTL